jgi:hypothetical protein
VSGVWCLVSGAGVWTIPTLVPKGKRKNGIQLSRNVDIHGAAPETPRQRTTHTYTRARSHAHAHAHAHPDTHTLTHTQRERERDRELSLSRTAPLRKNASSQPQSCPASFLPLSARSHVIVRFFMADEPSFLIFITFSRQVRTIRSTKANYVRSIAVILHAQVLRRPLVPVRKDGLPPVHQARIMHTFAWSHDRSPSRGGVIVSGRVHARP